MTARSTTAALPVPAAGSADAVHALLAAGSIANARRVSYDLDTTLLPQAVDSPGIDKKTARLLDALAAILVSRAQHEVIAIGAQVQHSNDLSDHSGKLQLVLAANAALPQTIQAYLEEAWKCMQLLAEHRQQLRLPEAKDQTTEILTVDSSVHGWLNLYRLFQKKLFVEIVDYPRMRVTLPTSKDAWATLIDTALNSAKPLKPIEPQVIQNTVVALSTRFSDKSVSCEIHCECKILQRFTTTAYKIKPINYIGVSKLSCIGCAAVFDSYNELQNSRGHRFYTRGAHGKWYFPWFLPKVGGGVKQIDFTNLVYTKLAGQYAQYLKTVALSDSSALSEGSQEVSGTPEDFMYHRATILEFFGLNKTWKGWTALMAKGGTRR
ncbi:hypothetical protein FN846DRAFT_988545 [Sphaerosporella brunnea]|uniref:Uncharacterized protein n=1 Tax=Sphaerosporella brunnea TaxID=1250544 RepID=A0A5J5F9L4_9PEZI|nr:hypothetical protein FN846DRAFT_988545 [Sphaerosporella brunnea]